MKEQTFGFLHKISNLHTLNHSFSIMSTPPKNILRTIIFAAVFIVVGAFLAIILCRTKVVPWCKNTANASDTVYVTRTLTFPDLCATSVGLPPGSESTSVLINNNQADVLKSAFYSKYSTATPNLVQGGILDKCLVLSAINNLNTSQNFLRYSFGYDMASNRIVLLFSANTASSPAEQMYYRTGMNDRNFCPLNCYP